MTQPPPDGILHFEKPSLKTVLCLPKVALSKTTHNPNATISHNYSIAEDMAQALAIISSLEVLQCFQIQCKALLSTNGGVDPLDSNITTFDPSLWKLHLPHHLAFHIMAQIFR